MLLFCDSFDHYETPQIGWKYLNFNQNVTIQLTGGRTGLNCLNFAYDSILGKAFPNTANFIVGMALNPTPGWAADFLNFGDDGVLQGTLTLNAAGGISYFAYPNGVRTLVGSSTPGAIPPNTYSYVEINVVFQPTATGSVALQINGQPIFSISGIITSATSDSYANTVTFFNNDAGGTFLIDDFYVCDGTGGVNNSFLGDVSVEALLPTDDGSVNQWTPSGAEQNWQLVHNYPINTSNYVYSSTPGDTDSYTFQNIASGVTVVAVQVVAAAEKDDSNTRLLQVGFGNGTTFAYDETFSLTSSYIMYPQPFDVDPITETAWTVANVNSGELAIMVVE